MHDFNKRIEKIRDSEQYIVLENNIVLTSKEFSNILYSNEFYVFMKEQFNFQTSNLHAVSEFVDVKIADLAES